MDQKKTIRPFSMKDKIGYTLGDLGCCFTEQYRAMYPVDLLHPDPAGQPLPRGYPAADHQDLGRRE